ncbi:MAG: serine hydrolase, partial [Myxococcota bacterium]
MSGGDDQQEYPEVSVADIDRCIQTGIYQKTFSAAVCVASVGGRIFHRAVYGSLTQPPPIRKLDFDTSFDLASLTKPLGSGLAALMLASQNRIDLNASVSKTIPELRDSKWAPVSIDMLLDHTAGLPAFRSYWQEIVDADKGVHEAKKVGGTAKAIPLVKKAVADTVFEYEPGSKAVYSDIGFMILGWIVEGLVGKPLDVYLARDIFRELDIADDLFFIRHDDTRQMQRLRRRTFAATEECAWREKVLQGEVHDPNAWIMGGVAGHAGLFGTADAVWKVAHALWESQKGEGRTFLGGTVRRFWTRSKRLRDTSRALAWDTQSSHGSSCGTRFS